jgi:hypothetical protein
MKKPSFFSDQQDKFMLRLPDGMRERIKAAAEANRRSMNAEIVATLDAKYPSLTGAQRQYWESWQVRAQTEPDPEKQREIVQAAARLMNLTDPDISMWIEERDGGKKRVVVSGFYKGRAEKLAQEGMPIPDFNLPD